MDKYLEAASQIIKEQESVIGPIALDLANRAEGISVVNNSEVKIEGDPKNALGNLVGQYYQLFGNTSIEVSKKAIKSIFTGTDLGNLPDILK